MTAAVGLWVRVDWRRRSRTLLWLTVLVGLAAGGVMTAAAGARRTATSLERLATASRSADVLVDVGDGGLAAARRIGGLPSVAQSAAATVAFAVVDGVQIDIGLFMPRDGVVGDTLERDLLLRGRRADPTRPDEVTVNEPTATLAGIDVGAVLDIRTLSPEQVDAEQYDPPRGPVVHATVTGVTQGPSDLSARPEGNIRATPALYPEVAGAVDEFTTYVVVRLGPGDTVDELERDLASVAPDAPFDVLPYAVFTRPARQTISTLAVGLAVLAAVAAVAALVVVGQTVGRHVEGGARDDATMRALGLVPRQRIGALGATVLPVAVVAPFVAVAVAIVASPLAPIGLARRAEPDPGVRIDVPALLFGAVATAAVVGLAGVVSAALVTRPPRLSARRRPSSAATAAAQLGAAPPVVHGVALALDRPTTGRSVRSTLAAIALTIVVATASITFVASLDRLAGSSDRWGSPWDLSLNFTSAEVGPAADQLAGDDALEAVARWDSGAALVDGEYVRAFSADLVRGELGFTLVEGRQPHAGEVVIGPGTAERGRVAIGDDVVVAAPDGENEDSALRVVGIALFPEIDDGDFVDAIGMNPADFAAHATVPDLFEASQLVVVLAPGASPTATEDRLRQQFAGALADGHPVRPGVVGNLIGVLPIPRVLLVFAGLLGLGALAYAVRSTPERPECGFATLRAIGMTRRQRWFCSLSQSVAIATAALIAGLPLGIILGRVAWGSVATSIDVAPDPLLPPVAVALVVGCVLLGSVVAAAAVRPAIHPRPAVASAS